MEQRLYIKMQRSGHHKAREIAEKLVQHFGTEAFSQLKVCQWMREFAQGREQTEDARRSGRPPDLICHSRIQVELEEMPHSSVR
jgi:hypothetical protein